MHKFFTIIFVSFFFISKAQTIGGNAAYNFLKLPADPLLTAAGGVNTSYVTNEVGLSANNPSLLNADLNGQLNLSFNNFIAGIKTYSLTGAYQYDKLNTALGGHIYFVDYGTIQQTDAAGNVSGNFHPVDFVIQLSAAKKYLDKWSYGASLKFINSNYQQFKSTAMAIDFGVLYADSTNGFSASILAKNMGLQLTTYSGRQEDIPFDLEIGFTKKLSKAPLGFSVTAQHVQQFAILYNDTTFNAANNFLLNNNFFNKVLNHFVVATHIYLGNNLEAIIGYNHLRRAELNIGSSGNGLNGFSMGLRIKFEKLQILYARSNYQRNISYNQVGINLQLNKLFGLGE